MIRDGDCVELFECGDVEQKFDLEDHELNELEKCGGGYQMMMMMVVVVSLLMVGEGDKRIIS